MTANTTLPGPLDRFLGSNVSILNCRDIQVNNYVSLRAMAVSFGGNVQPEEFGKLYLFPIDDNRFCLQLCYLFFRGDEAIDATVYSLVFQPDFFTQFPSGALMANQPFRFDRSTEQQFGVCAQSLSLLEQMENAENFSQFTHLLHQSQAAISLLNRTLECIAIPFAVCQVPACRFLAYEREREKIQEACAIIARHEGKPHTIRELSRKVAMNECYLKKGFKALTGKTIYEYQQEIRIDKARRLLQSPGHSVTDVAIELGYSSISHFSTAFKRVTGMKPCELIQ